MQRAIVLAAIVPILVLAGALVYQAPGGAQAGPVALSGYPWGDVNCSGEPNSIDAAIVLQYGAGLTVFAECFHLGDVNADGEKNAVDAALILQYEAGLIDELVPPPFDFGPASEAAGGAPMTGDVDCGGAVNSVDAALILQYGAGLVAQLSCPGAADTNQDGTINAIDASLVLQYDAALIDSLPPFISPTPTPCPCGWGRWQT